MTGDFCVLKFLRGSVDEKHLMREASIFKFPQGRRDRGLNRPFPHSRKQWRRVEVRMDKNTVNV